MREYKFMRFMISSFEDHELLDYVKSKVFKNIKYENICKTTVIRPMNYVFKNMDKYQKQLFLSLKKNSPGEECPICYTNIDFRNKATTNCNHAFCCNCLQTWVRNDNKNCPCCRTTIEYYNSFPCCANGSHEYKYRIYSIGNNDCFVKPFYSRYPYLL
jgi:hypothetical protein